MSYNKQDKVKLTSEEERIITEWGVDWQINGKPIEQIAEEYEASPRLVAEMVRAYLAFIQLPERNPEELSKIINKEDIRIN